MRFVLVIALALMLPVRYVFQQANGITATNVAQISVIGRIDYPDARIWDLTFQPHTNILTAIIDQISGSPPTRHYDVTFINSGSLEIMAQTETALEATAVAYTPDGLFFATGNTEGAISVYDTATFRPISNLPAIGNVVTDLAFNRDGSLLGVTVGNPMLAGESEYAVQLLAVPSGELIYSYPFGDGVYGGGVTFDDSGDQLFFSTTEAIREVHDAVIAVWEESSGEVRSTSYQARAFSDELIFEPQSRALFYIGNESVHITYPSAEDAHGDTELGFEQEGEMITTITVHPDEPVLAVGYFVSTPRPDGGPSLTNAGIIRLYQSETGEELAKIDVPEGAINNLAFSPDGTLLASGGADGTVRLWGIPSGQ